MYIHILEQVPFFPSKHRLEFNPQLASLSLSFQGCKTPKTPILWPLGLGAHTLRS